MYSNYKVLVACEESQTVCCAFRQRGFISYSCDVQEPSGEHPEWHIKDDVRNVIDEGWDLIIAHPPCTYISNAGAKHLFRNHTLNMERYEKGLKGVEFFNIFLECSCPHVAIENPIPSKIYGLPQYSQIIQPYEYGHPYSKKTCLWLKNLPLLCPTDVVSKDIVSSTRQADWYQKGNSVQRQKNRSKTFPGIAQAMASQWGDYIVSY